MYTPDCKSSWSINRNLNRMLDMLEGVVIVPVSETSTISLREAMLLTGSLRLTSGVRVEIYAISPTYYRAIVNDIWFSWSDDYTVITSGKIGQTASYIQYVIA